MTEQRPPYGRTRISHAELDREMQTVERIAQLASLIDYDRLARGLDLDGLTLDTLPEPLRRRVTAGRERVRKLAEALAVVARIERETGW